MGLSRWTKLVCLVLLLGAVNQAKASVLIDFELGAPQFFIDQVPLTNEYAGLGVHFSGQGEVLNMSTFSFGAHSGTDALAFNSAAPAVGPELISFDFNVQSVSLFIAMNGRGSTNVTLLDASNNTLASINSSGTVGSYFQFGFAGFSAARAISVNSTADVWAVDDISFEAAPGGVVPEPASWGIFAMGLVALGAKRRKAGRFSARPASAASSPRSLRLRGEKTS